jgi:hypothetical protein
LTLPIRNDACRAKTAVSNRGADERCSGFSHIYRRLPLNAQVVNSSFSTSASRYSFRTGACQIAKMAPDQAGA